MADTRRKHTKPTAKDFIGLSYDEIIVLCTPLEQQFIELYLRVPDATAAYRQVYECKNWKHQSNVRLAASKLRRHPRVAAAITAGLLDRWNMSPEWVKSRLLQIADSSFENFLVVDENGKPQLDFGLARQQQALGQVKKLHIDGKTGDVSIELHDPTNALLIVARMHGLIQNRVDVTSGGKPIKGYVDIDDGEDAPVGQRLLVGPQSSN